LHQEYYSRKGCGEQKSFINNPEVVKIQRLYSVEKNDFTGAGEVSSHIKKIMKQVGVKPEIIRRVSVAAYEAEMNIIIHSDGGTIEFTIDVEKIKLIILDRGPGIEDVELALKEGYSTASKDVRELGFGAGMGLPNIKRCADTFLIESEFGKYTKLSIEFNQ
jgi:serine/threonine-protein kinase RsbT